MEDKKIFCYWDDPAEWRNDRKTKNYNDIPNIEQEQKTPTEDIREHEAGRHYKHDHKESDSTNSLGNR